MTTMESGRINMVSDIVMINTAHVDIKLTWNFVTIIGGYWKTILIASTAFFLEVFTCPT